MRGIQKSYAKPIETNVTVKTVDLIPLEIATI